LKALVLGAGAPPPPELVDRHIAGARMVVCADGAVNWARAMGLMPDAVVGDMDSVRPEALDEPTRRRPWITRSARGQTRSCCWG